MRIVIFRSSHGFFSKKRIPARFSNKMGLKRKLFIFHGLMNIKDSSCEAKKHKIIFSKGKIKTSTFDLKFNYLGHD